MLRKKLRQSIPTAQAPARAVNNDDAGMRALLQGQTQCSGKGYVAVAELYFLFIAEVRFNLFADHFGRASRFPLECSHLTLLILDEGGIYLNRILLESPW